MQKRNPCPQRRSLGDQGKVHDFLNVVGAEHGPTGGAAGHNVGMVAEDRQRLSGDGTGRNVEDGRG